MIVLILILILTGSFAGAATLWLQDASFWQIVLGYVAGGWAGLLLGMPVVILIRFLVTLYAPFSRRRSLLTNMKRQHPQGR